MFLFEKQELEREHMCGYRHCMKGTSKAEYGKHRSKHGKQVLLVSFLSSLLKTIRLHS